MLRGFTDSTGVEWRVWEVFPSKGGTGESSAEELSRSTLKDTAYANGWLCFESASEKRRLAPIPEGWGFHEPKRLEELLGQAIFVPVRKRRNSA